MISRDSREADDDRSPSWLHRAVTPKKPCNRVATKQGLNTQGRMPERQLPGSGYHVGYQGKAVFRYSRNWCNTRHARKSRKIVMADI